MILVLFLYGGFRLLPWTKGKIGHATSLGVAIGFFLAPILSITPTVWRYLIKLEARRPRDSLCRKWWFFRHRWFWVMGWNWI